MEQPVLTSEERIEQVAGILFAAALAFTNNIGRKGWAWELADEGTKQYWRNIARHVGEVFSGRLPQSTP